MRGNATEGVMAAVVLVVAGFFLSFAIANDTYRPVAGYPLAARFSDAGGLQPGADVRLHGIVVGTVIAITIDRQSLTADVAMAIRPNIRLPVDTTAAIETAGTVSSTKDVSLIPGTAQRELPANGRITRTQAFRPLEQTVGNVIFQSGLGPGP